MLRFYRSIWLCAGLFLLCLQSMSAQDLRTISGIIRDSASGEAVIGATVAVYKDSAKGKPLRGTVANKYGFFSIPKLQRGNYLLLIRAISYQPHLQNISATTLDKNEQILIHLIPVAIKGKEVVVEAERNVAAPTQNISSVSVSSDFIRSMPALLGETDVFRVMQLLPGVKSPSELSSGLYVRGGSPDQNLILLDGVIVYNPSHLGGFLSTFNNDALRDVRLIKGAFPAEYGGRLSSVIDMTMKDGTKEKIQGQGGISLISSRLTVEGPINKDATFMISGRRMYLDLLLGLIGTGNGEEETPDYYFYDLNAKLNYKLSESDRLYASGFFGRDVFSSNPGNSNSSSFDISWGNSTANLRWAHIFSNEIFSNFSCIYTTYRFGTDLQFRNGNDSSATSSFFSRSQIRDITLKGDVQYFAAEDHILKAGIEATHHLFGTSVSDEFDPQSGEFIANNNSVNAVDAALYLQDEWHITPQLFANIGSRLYYFQSGGYVRFEPRLQLAYQLTEDVKLTSSFAIANQFLHLIVRNDINLPTDLWFPSTSTILPGSSTQGVLGVETTFGEKNEYLFTAEAYYKDMRNLYEYKDTASFSLFTPLESQFTSGRGEAYGVELFLNKRIGDFTGWVGYTLSWTRRYFDELNRGNPFWARYDRRHDISLTFSYKLSDDIDFGAAWTFGTGFAYTMPVGQYIVDYDSQNPWYSTSKLYTERNGYRLPAYHRLDINLGFKLKVFGLPSTLALSVYNVYNRRNPFAQYVENKYDPNTNESRPVLKQFTLFPLLPVLSWNFNF